MIAPTATEGKNSLSDRVYYEAPTFRLVFQASTWPPGACRARRWAAQSTLEMLTSPAAVLWSGTWRSLINRRSSTTFDHSLDHRDAKAPA